MKINTDTLIMTAVITADIAIWFAVYFLVSRAHLRNAELYGGNKNLKAIRIAFIVAFVLLHILFIWLGYELRQSNGFTD